MAETKQILLNDLPGGPMPETLTAKYAYNANSVPSAGLGDPDFGYIQSVHSLDHNSKLPGFNPLTGEQLVVDVVGIRQEGGSVRDWFVRTIDGKELTFQAYGDLLGKLGTSALKDFEEEQVAEPKPLFNWEDIKSGKAAVLDPALGAKEVAALKIAQNQGYESRLSVTEARGVINGVDKIITDGIKNGLTKKHLRWKVMEAFHPDLTNGTGIDPQLAHNRSLLAGDLLSSSKEYLDLK